MGCFHALTLSLSRTQQQPPCAQNSHLSPLSSGLLFINNQRRWHSPTQATLLTRCLVFFVVFVRVVASVIGVKKWVWLPFFSEISWLDGCYLFSIVLCGSFLTLLPLVSQPRSRDRRTQRVFIHCWFVLVKNYQLAQFILIFSQKIGRRVGRCSYQRVCVLSLSGQLCSYFITTTTYLSTSFLHRHTATGTTTATRSLPLSSSFFFRTTNDE